MVVLGYGLWRQRFGGDAKVAGKTITLSGHPFTVVGVAPPAFRGLDLILACQFWVPLGELDQLLPNTSNYNSRAYHWIAVVGRLKSGITPSQAEAVLKVLAPRLTAAHHEEDYDDGFRCEFGLGLFVLPRYMVKLYS